MAKMFPYVATAGTAALACALALPGMLPSPALASPASDYEEADAQAQSASESYDAAAAAHADAVQRALEAESRVVEQQAIVDNARAKASDAAVSMYKSTDGHAFWNMIFTSDDLADVIASLDAYVRISNWRNSTLAAANAEKRNLDDALEEARSAQGAAEQSLAEAEQAKIEANERRDAAREAYEQALAEEQAAAEAAAAASYYTASSQSSSQGAYAQTSSSWSDEQSAKEYIIYRESRGNYSATNGRYYGAYQLDSSYLGGDYSPEHQDEVAENYVRNRYGSWSSAAAFWDSHSWY